MASQPPSRACAGLSRLTRARRAPRAGSRMASPRSAISALGLAVAGSVALTTSAQTTGQHLRAAPLGRGRPLPVRSVLPVHHAGPGRAAQRPAASAASSPGSERHSAGARACSARSSRSRPLSAPRTWPRRPRTSPALARAKPATRGSRPAHRGERGQPSRRRPDRRRRASATGRRGPGRGHDRAQERGVDHRDRRCRTRPARPTDFGRGGGGGGGVSPVPGAVIGAHFGQYGLWSRYHTGLDFRAAYGTPIRAVKSGVVLFAGNSGDWAGNHVAIRHADGRTTMSSHMSSMAVRAGQTSRPVRSSATSARPAGPSAPTCTSSSTRPGSSTATSTRRSTRSPGLRANGVRTH